jgi:hypothetical protein
MTLETGEIEDMIERGYLTRELKLGAKDRAAVTAKVERQIAELQGLEASGKREEAATMPGKGPKAPGVAGGYRGESYFGGPAGS